MNCDNFSIFWSVNPETFAKKCWICGVFGIIAKIHLWNQLIHANLCISYLGTSSLFVDEQEIRPTKPFFLKAVWLWNVVNLTSGWPSSHLIVIKFCEILLLWRWSNWNLAQYTAIVSSVVNKLDTGQKNRDL